MRLVLFDIDGTLLLTDGAGKRAIHAALADWFGPGGPTATWFDGKTDRQIVRELLRAEGCDDSLIDREMDTVLERYLSHLERELGSNAHKPHLFAGVPELLDELEQRNDVLLGLLTGNLERGAVAKLRRLGLDPDRFVVGAYGSDHEHRPELPEIARSRACAHLGRQLEGSAVVVIGDTPADVQCGRSIGARAIGVATGRFSVEELAQHSPAAVFADLTDTRAVVGAILGE